MKPRQPEIREAELESPQAEKAVLGAFLNSETEFWNWYERVDESDFSQPLHRRIYRAMRVLALQNRALAPPLISSAMEKGEEHEKSPIPYMSALKVEAKGVIKIDSFVDKVKETAARRALIKVSQEINDLAYRGDTQATADRLIEQATKIVTSAHVSRGKETLRSAGEVALSVVDQMVATLQGKRSSGLQTRLPELNDLIGPMLPGELIVIPGATSSGKTALMQQILEDVAEGTIGQPGEPVGMIQAEMSAEAVVRRFVAQRAGVPAAAIANGTVNQSEDEKIMAAAESMRNLPLHIDAERDVTISGMIAKARRMKRKHGIKLLVIDHLREIIMDQRRGGDDNEFRHIAQVVQAAGNLAGELDIPVILGAQLKRDPTARDIKTARDIRLPGLADVWGGSAIEQKADTVLFVHRPHYYLERAEPSSNAKHYGEWVADMDRWKGRAQLVVGKRRGGKGFSVREVAYIDRLTRFETLYKADDLDDQPAMEF